MNILAVICIIIKNSIYGLSVFFTGSLTSSVAVPDILAIRFLLSFTVFYILKITGILKINVGIKDLMIKDKSDFKKRDLFLAMLFEPVLYMIFETLGISMTTGITTAVILALSPITGCIFESLILKEKTTFLQKVFLGIGIAGVIYIAANTNTSDGTNTVSGIMFLFFAVMSGSLFAVFSRKSSVSYSSLDRTYIYCLMGAICFNIINVIRHLFKGDITHYFDSLFDKENIIGFIFLSVISAIIATLLGNYALSKLQVTTTAAFGGFSTLVTIATGVLFANEKLYVYHIIGIALILTRIVGVSFIAARKKKQNTGHK